jgi:phosphonate transport system permease protein
MAFDKSLLIDLEKPNKLKSYFIIFIVVTLIMGSGIITKFDLIEMFSNLDESTVILKRMFNPPRWDYITRIKNPLLETIQMSIVGTTLGAILAFPVAVLAASNFLQKPVLHAFVKNILGIFRTVPALVLAALFVAVFGSGAFPGVLALSIFSFGLIAKLTYESIESIDEGQVEAIKSLGGNTLEVLRYGVIPQILPQFMSYTLYAFEVNVRAAAVLGYVGAGGIGESYEINLTYRRFDKVGMIILVTFAVVLIIDLISSSIRKRLV